jgi:2-haloacid dehalogenase
VAHDAILFDLGKVLLDWDPRYFYRRFLADEAALEHFVGTVVGMDWIVEMDAGKPAALAIAERSQAFPEHAALIARWSEGWPTMLRGEIAGSVEILAELRARGFRLYALTNFSTENYPVALERHAFLRWFEDVIVSAEHGLVKPDPRIYALAIARCRLDPARTVFIDDSPRNVEAGRAAGLHALHFTAADVLRRDLERLGVL